MLYRVVLVLLFLVAVVLTLNERWQEQHSREAAEIGSAPVGVVTSGAPASNAARTSAAGTFTPHRVRTRQQVTLLSTPVAGSPPAQPADPVPPGIVVEAVEQRDGWYLLDTQLVKGWAPTDVVDEP